MPDTPLVSVITPAFNAVRHIAETVRSVQAQTLDCWEMLIADDCSQDGTGELVRRLAAEDSRLRLITLTRNAGPAAARNAALAEAKGRYLAFLDSDDLWLPEKLERQIVFMTERDCAFSYTAYRRISQDSQCIGRLIAVPERMTYAKLLKNTAIASVTVMLDRQKLGAVRMTDAGYDDFVLWLKILKTGVVAQGLQEDLARYRSVRDSVSSRPLRSADWVWTAYRDIEKLGWAYSVYCLCHYGIRAAFKRLRF